MAKSKLAQLKELGEALYLLRREIEVVEAESKAVLDPLKRRKDELQEEMRALFGEVGLASIKNEAGETISVVPKKEYVVVNEIYALPWAKEHGAVRIDSRLLAQKLSAMEPEKVPAEAFQLVESSYISVRKPAPPKKEGGTNES